MSLPNQVIMPADGAPNPFTIPRYEPHLPMLPGFLDLRRRRRRAHPAQRRLGVGERRRHRRFRRDLRPAGQRPQRTGLHRHDDRRPGHLRWAEGRLAASQHRRLGLSAIRFTVDRAIVRPFPLRGKVVRRTGWGAESRDGSFEVRREVRASLRAVQQPAIPHPAFGHLPRFSRRRIAPDIRVRQSTGLFTN